MAPPVTMAGAQRTDAPYLSQRHRRDICALGSALEQEGESPSLAELPVSNRK